MHSEKTEHGIMFVMEEEYPNGKGKSAQLISESLAIGDYEDSWDKPGSSFLFVGERHHLNREQVLELIERMLHWLKTGRLAEDKSDSKGVMARAN